MIIKLYAVLRAVLFAVCSLTHLRFVHEIVTVKADMSDLRASACKWHNCSSLAHVVFFTL